MGFVIKQSIQNTIVTYIGFAVGAINTLFLFTQYLSKEAYGIVTYTLAATNMLWPIMAFGFHNTIIKYFKKFELSNQHQQFFTWMLMIPLLLAICFFTVLWFNQEFFESFYASNPGLKKALFPIFLLALAFAYFELYYAWARAHLQSVQGNFLKQIFNRVGICLLLILVYKKILNEHQFLYGLVIVSFSRTLIMKTLAYQIELPVFKFENIPHKKQITSYSIVILFAVMVAVFLLDLDKVMIERYLPVEEVAVYSIMVYMASVIEVPLKSMMQITTPLTSNYLEEKQFDELSKLNKSTSITTLIVAGLIALLIFCNAEAIYQFIPDQYTLHLDVLFIICLIKLIEASLGITSAILYNSDYYKWLLFFGVIVTAVAVGLNIWLIPVLGLKGAAIASLSAYIFYDIIKLFWVKKCFNIHPFNIGFLKIVLIIIVLGLLFRWISFLISPTFLSLVVKSIILILAYVSLVYLSKTSKMVNNFLASQWLLIKKKLS